MRFTFALFCSLTAALLASAVLRAADDKPNESEVLALREFQKAYALDEGENLKWVPEPFIESRLLWYRLKHSAVVKDNPAGPDSMMLRWQDDQLSTTFSRFGEPFDLNVMLQYAFGLAPYEIEAGKALLATKMPGDFVFREGVDRSKCLPELAAAFKRETKNDVRMQFREVDRKVLVAKGKYKYTPIIPGSKTVDLFGVDAPDTRNFRFASIEFNGFLRQVAFWIGRPIFAGEIEDAPKQVEWRELRPIRFTREAQKANHDPTSVINNLEKQTGLTFSEETRKVRILFIEKVE